MCIYSFLCMSFLICLLYLIIQSLEWRSKVAKVVKVVKVVKVIKVVKVVNRDRDRDRGQGQVMCVMARMRQVIL